MKPIFKGLLLILLAAIFIAAFTQVFLPVCKAQEPSSEGAHSMKTKKGWTYYEEYVEINGISQYLLHSGMDKEKPVLLFLHGGPGTAESLFGYLMQQAEEFFTIVHWDQRGAGKTLIKNPQAYPTMELMLADLLEIVQYLKDKYRQEKVILIGHSWGSVLASVFIREYPEEVAYYIGVGQVVSVAENERVGFEELKRRVEEAGDKRSMKKIEKIGDYPGENFKMDSEFMKKCGQVRSLQKKYDLAVKPSWDLIKATIRSPIYRLSDAVAMFKAQKANEALIEEFLGGFDLNKESLEYRVPVYYILGDKDWQTPYILASEYLEKIQAPAKGLYLIPGAGHFTMLDQPELFYQALASIVENEDKRQGNNP